MFSGRRHFAGISAEAEASDLRDLEHLFEERAELLEAMGLEEDDKEGLVCSSQPGLGFKPAPRAVHFRIHMLLIYSLPGLDWF